MRSADGLESWTIIFSASIVAEFFEHSQLVYSFCIEMSSNEDNWEIGLQEYESFDLHEYEAYFNELNELETATLATVPFEWTTPYSESEGQDQSYV